MLESEALRERAEQLARGIELIDETLTFQKYTPQDVLVDLVPRPGMTWSTPYQGEPFDPQKYRLIKGGWNHEHCSMCKARVIRGDFWWATATNETGLCPDCHTLLEEFRDALESLARAGLGHRAHWAERKKAPTLTEAEWFASTTPNAMLNVLEERAKTGEIDRKMRLFACACVRRIEHLLTDGRSRAVVEVAERFAEGLASPEELDGAKDEAEAAEADLYTSSGIEADYYARLNDLPETEHPAGSVFGERDGDRAWRAARTAKYLALRKLFGGNAAWSVARSSARNSSEVLADSARLRAEAAEEAAIDEAVEAPLLATDAIAGAAEILKRDAARSEMIESRRWYEESWQADLLRCVMGNPFRPLALDPAWLTPATVALAGSIDESRAFDRLPDLADALEAAGCHDIALLAHCREPGEHARGCWVVDAVLGKA